MDNIKVMFDNSKFMPIEAALDINVSIVRDGEIVDTAILKPNEVFKLENDKIVKVKTEVNG